MKEVTNDPKDVGFDAERLARVIEAIDRDVAAERYDGAALCVGRHGRIALNAARGYGERTTGRKLDIDSVFCSMSTGKLFTVAVVLNRVERGDLRLAMPVAEIIPEFGKRGKERIKLHHLLTHTSGLMGMLNAHQTMPAEALLSVEGATAFAAASLVESLPGGSVNFSPFIAHSVMAEMVRRTEGSKRSFREIVEQDLFLPLGMRDTSLGLRQDLAKRLNPVVCRYTEAELLDPSPVAELGKAFATAEFPAGGYFTTVGDLHRFAEMLRRGGELDGQRILSPAMLDFATRNHTGTMTNNLFDCAVGIRGWETFPASLGLGFFVRGEGVVPGPFGNLWSSRAFGHVGGGSTALSVDPKYDVTFSFLSTGLMADTYHWERLSRLSDMVLSAIVD